ncbi:MAG: MBL fold metallo-hydrolase [Acidobacteriota bacterium]|nr:MBL fold metallo-hydrolase [Acidobacteriota bacterium]
MKVHHINVGQGEATLLEFKTAAVLIDAGSFNGTTARTHLFEYLDRFFDSHPALNRTFYSLIVTHPHFDHTRFITEVMNRYRVRNFVDNGDTGSGGGFNQINEVREFIRRRNEEQPNSIIYNKVDAEDIDSDGYTTQWFRDLQNSASQAEIIFLNASTNCDSPNNDSLVVRIRYKQRTILITGDAEWEPDSRCTPAIPRMLQRFASGSLMDIDVYKVGHHGSRNGTNEAYLNEMTPRIAVISAGFHTDNNANEFGHPRKSVIDQILSVNSLTSRPPKQAYGMSGANGNPISLTMTKAIYCTCWDGDIVVPINSAGQLRPVQTSN